MLLSHTPRHVAGVHRSRSITVQAAKGGGFGSKRNKASRRSKPATPEVQKLLGEYSAVKQPPTNLAPTASGRAAPTDRTKRPTTEASATTHPHSSKPAPADQGSSSSSNLKPAAPAASATGSKASAAPTADKQTGAAAAAAPRSKASSSDKSSSSSSSSGSSPTAAAAASEPLAPPPLPTSFTAAGARISSFESKLTSRQPPSTAEPAEAQPPPPAAAAGSSLAHVPATSVARLSTAAEGLSAAEEHVEGLAQLLREAQATLASLRPDAGDSPDPAAAAVSAAADSLVSMMSDVLTDITAEMGLVREQLVAAGGDLTDIKQQLEAAMAAAAPVIEPGMTSAREVGESDLEILEAREAAAVAAAAAAAKRESEIKQTLEMRDAELAVAQQRTAQLQAQLALVLPGGDSLDAAAAAAAAAAETTTDPRVHQLLVAQVASNMAMLDWLGALAKTIVGLEGVSPKDRVKLATTISKCVLAVGGGGKNSPSTSMDKGPTQQQDKPEDEF